MTQSPTARFSDRVENYVRYRPGYPPEVLDLLRAECGLQPSHIVADVASGTGVFTRLLLENGNSVFAVEPNTEMREAGVHELESYDRLVSVAGTAEETTLRSASVDFVTAAQAAHWFDLPRARAEFVRILRPGGWCVLIWNERRTATTPFLRDYEQLLLTYGTDYQGSAPRTHDRLDPQILRACAVPGTRLQPVPAVRLRRHGRTIVVFFVRAARGSSQLCTDDAGTGANISRSCHRWQGRIRIQHAGVLRTFVVDEVRSQK
jgi:SAM-dependent methyltransferase